MAEKLAGAHDRDLVRLLNRDPDALEEFYRRHVRAVTGFVARAVGDPHDTADLVAATFVAAIESADRYDASRGEPRGWLFGIAGNIVATKWRRRAAEGRALAKLEARPAAGGDEYDAVDDRVDAQRLAEPALAALHLLPPAERELIDLVLATGFNLTEAAGVLGIRPGTARMRWTRARARLALAVMAGQR